MLEVRPTQRMGEHARGTIATAVVAPTVMRNPPNSHTKSSSANTLPGVADTKSSVVCMVLLPHFKDKLDEWYNEEMEAADPTSWRYHARQAARTEAESEGGTVGLGGAQLAGLRQWLIKIYPWLHAVFEAVKAGRFDELSLTGEIVAQALTFLVWELEELKKQNKTLSDQLKSTWSAQLADALAILVHLCDKLLGCS